MTDSSSRGLVRSMLVVGGAQSAGIVISIVRMKLLAMMLGPAGIGLLSIYVNLQQITTNAAGLGLGSSGVREIAGARAGETDLGHVRRVLLGASLAQGVLAMVVLWLLREPLALWLLGEPGYATEVGLVGVVVVLKLVGLSRMALLRGMRRIGDFARVTVLGSLSGAVAGLVAVLLMGERGLIVFLLVQELGVLAFAWYYARRLPRTLDTRLSARDAWSAWKRLALLGSVFMISSLATTGTLLLVRGWVTQELGIDAAGQFAAAWSITMTYIGFLLSAMAADYYPRLTEVIRDRPVANRLINDQLQLSLSIGGPVLLVLIGLAPVVIRLLYTAEFTPAVELLQWQSLGNILKIAAWALSFSIVAAARSRAFLMMELSFNFVFLVLVWALLPTLGLFITALGFVAGYAVYFIVVNTLARRLQGFRWERLSLRLLWLHLALGAGVLALALNAPLAGAVAGTALAVITGTFGLHIVLGKIGPAGRVPAKLARIYAAIGWPVGEST